jgi:hypothetical protein
VLELSAWHQKLKKQPCPCLYIGSTSISVARREYNRTAVYRRLQRMPRLQAELATRYLPATAAFEQLTVLQCSADFPCDSYKNAWSLEHEPIDVWQPRLNCPFVQMFVQRSGLGFRHKQTFRAWVAGQFGPPLVEKAA